MAKKAVGAQPEPAPEGRADGPGDEELLAAPDRGSADELLDAGAHDELDAMRHSTAHVMAEAVLDLFPGAKLGIGPAVADAFYYDFELPRALTPADLEAIEVRMRESVVADHTFVRREGQDAALALYSDRVGERLGVASPTPAVVGGDDWNATISERRDPASAHFVGLTDSGRSVGPDPLEL